MPLETKSKKNIKISVIKKIFKKLNKQIIIKCRFERVGWKTVETEKLV